MKSVIVDVYPATIIKDGEEVPMPKEQFPARVNPLVCYEIDNGEDAEFAKLPDFLKKKIRESDEFKKPMSSQEEAESQDPANVAESAHDPVSNDDDTDDDIPF